MTQEEQAVLAKVKRLEVIRDAKKSFKAVNPKTSKAIRLQIANKLSTGRIARTARIGLRSN